MEKLATINLLSLLQLLIIPFVCISSWIVGLLIYLLACLLDKAVNFYASSFVLKDTTACETFASKTSKLN